MDEYDRAGPDMPPGDTHRNCGAGDSRGRRNPFLHYYTPLVKQSTSSKSPGRIVWRVSIMRLASKRMASLVMPRAFYPLHITQAMSTYE